MTRRVITIMLVAAVFTALTPLYAQWTNPVAEDFNGEWTTSPPPPGWTINYDGSAGNSDWHRYSNWSQTGPPCARIYWSPSETGTDELISPVFDCSDADTACVAATHYYSHYSSAYTAQWLGSIDGGATFPYVIFDYYQSTYGPARDSVIFPEAAGEANVCINFRGDGYTWNMNYWYLDDVAVWIHEGGGPGGCEDLLYEQFNGSWTTASHPAGWTIVYDPPADYSDWFNGGWNGSSSANGVPNMVYWGDYGYVQTDEFISPTFDCSFYDYVYIAFDHEYSRYGGTYENQILGSIDGGQTWNYVIWDYANSSYPYQRDSFDITSWAAGESQVAFNWRCYGDPWFMNYRGFDNLRVAGCVEGMPPKLDLQVIQIIRPYDEEEGGVAFIPRCRILNTFSVTTVEALIRCQIKDMATLQTVYTDVHNSYPLDPGYNDVEGFKYFTPEGNSTYEVLCKVEHQDDVIPQNNDKTKRFTTVAGKDVTPIQMISPQDSLFLPFTPKARFEERAGAPETDAWCHCMIEDMTAYGQELYHDSTLKTFSAGEIKDVEFTEVRAGDIEPGAYTITFWSKDYHGEEISDPDFIGSFLIQVAVAEAPVVSAFGLSVVNNTVNFSLAKATDVSLKLFDVAGNMVAELASGSYDAGSYGVSVPDMTSGVYFVRLVTPLYIDAAKVIILK